MSLTTWKEFEDLFFDPWRRYHPAPYWRRNPWTDDFGFGLSFRDLVPREFREMQGEVERRAQQLEKDDGVVSSTGKDGFQVCMDVQQFSPNEVTVKVNGDSVIVEGKHEERQDNHGYIARQFVRRYALPSGYDANTITSELSSDGVLTIKAPLPKALESNERQITIQQTGPARLNVKENEAIQEPKPNV